MCQGCVDTGCLSQATHDAIEAFLEQWPDAEFGPAHVVLADDNVLDGNIHFCLNEMRGMEETQELSATRAFLEALLAIPEEHR